jgi:hypothetical protein
MCQGRHQKMKQVDGRGTHPDVKTNVLCERRMTDVKYIFSLPNCAAERVWEQRDKREVHRQVLDLQVPVAPRTPTRAAIGNQMSEASLRGIKDS